MAALSGLFDRMILIGGPPRSGTKLAAWILNCHPQIAAAIDDHVYECWALYYYPTRIGMVDRLRKRPLSRRTAARILENHLVCGQHLIGVAPSEKTSGYPESRPPVRPDFEVTSQDVKLIRHTLPLDPFFLDRHLCLKSPEISFVLPQLAAIFPGARFVLVYRPVSEIAESMYRKGNNVKNIPVYHARWKKEHGEDGGLAAPPGVPLEWTGLWKSVSDFQRCVIYGASYIRALEQGLRRVKPERYFVYNHTDLRRDPQSVLTQMARFLNADAEGFQAALKRIRPQTPPLPKQLQGELDSIGVDLELEGLFSRIKMLDSLILDYL
ncbi:MAG: sulfotransferase [Candidatus Aminicenantes bacterium]|nr:sulfotransferase [Candidatus Aminicenantes bacterium]